MECPRCKGEKVIHGFGCPGFKPIAIPCPQCDGSGSVISEMAQWIEHGKKLRDERVKRRITLREMAKFKGLSAVELSDIELGRVNNLGINYGEVTIQKVEE